MTMVVSTVDEDVEIWQNPEDKHDIFTVGDIFKSFGMENALLEFLADIEDGKEPNLERLNERCEALGISPSPCPLCGKYSWHSHDL